MKKMLKKLDLLQKLEKHKNKNKKTHMDLGEIKINNVIAKRVKVKNKKPLLILLLLVVVLVLVGAGLYLQNKKNVKTINIEESFSSAASGKDATGKALSIAERNQAFTDAAAGLASKVNTNPTDTASLEKLAGAYYNLEKYSEAIDAYKKLIQISPNNALYYTNMAHAYLAASQLDLATQNYQKSISIDSTMIINYIQLTNIFQQEGNKVEEKNILDQGLAQYPDNEILKSSLEEYNKS